MRSSHVTIYAGGAVLAALLAGTLLYPDFWSRPDRRGDALMRAGRFQEAARTYADPLRRGVALYRDGRFKQAVAEFARVPGATGAYNTGNAQLMQGQYRAAIVSFDKALGFRSGWQNALDNKRLAIARRDALTLSDEERAQEATEAYDPDEIVHDLQGENKNRDPEQKPMQGEMNDAELQATWLRRVKTTPGEFLKAKFAWQAQTPPAP